MNFSPVAILNTSTQEKTYSFLGYTGFTTDSTSFSLSANAAAGHLVIGIHWEQSSSRTLTLSVNGVNATQVYGANQGGTVTALYAIPIDGSTSNVTASFSGNVLRCGMSLWSLQNFTQVPLPLSEQGGTSAGSSVYSNIISSYYPGDLVIMVLSTQGTNANISWTNATSRYSENLENLMSVSGADFVLPNYNNYPYSASFAFNGFSAAGGIFR